MERESSMKVQKQSNYFSCKVNITAVSADQSIRNE